MGYAKSRKECNLCNGDGYTYELYDNDYVTAKDKNNPNNYEREWCNECGGSGTIPTPDWMDIILGRYR